MAQLPSWPKCRAKREKAVRLCRHRRLVGDQSAVLEPKDAIAMGETLVAMRDHQV
jgi:hypothetical protein